MARNHGRRVRSTLALVLALAAALFCLTACAAKDGGAARDSAPTPPTSGAIQLAEGSSVQIFPTAKPANAASSMPESPLPAPETQAPAPENLPPLEITFYSVGKADAMLILCGDSAVMVDTGKNKAGKTLAADLAARGIDTLDALIITHFDNDHVGGADTVVERVAVKQAIYPTYHKESKQHDAFMAALEARNVPQTALSENATFTWGGATFDIDVANRTDYGADEENDFSLVIRLTHGKNRVLLAGDAENPRLRELLVEGDLRSDLLKVPHHGVYEDSSEAFFKAVAPRCAVVTSDDKADDREEEATMLLLRAVGCEIFLTREGQVTATSDGETLHVTQAR